MFMIDIHGTQKAPPVAVNRSSRLVSPISILSPCLISAADS